MNIKSIEFNVDFALSQIKDVKYMYDDMLTICIITTLSDFKFVGTSSCFYREKYNQIIGMETAREKATQKLIEAVAFHAKTVNFN